MAFPGESIGLDAAADVTGAPDEDLVYAITNRGGLFPGDPASQVITSGDRWLTLVYPGEAAYLTDPGEDVVISWVVEVLSGSGILDLAEGLDPLYGDYDLNPTDSLGSHPVEGPGTVVVASSRTAADVISGDDAMALEIQCSSGSLEVQQVKLRVWPSAGITGSWVDYQDPTPAGPFAPTMRQVAPNLSTTLTDPSALDPDDALATMQADLRAQQAAATTASSANVAAGSVFGLGASSGASVLVTSTTAGSAGAVAARLHFRRNVPESEPPGVDGIDWSHHPDEVRSDLLGAPEATDTGTATWLQGTVTVTSEPAASDGGDPLPGSATLHGDSFPAPPYPTASTVAWEPIAGGATLRKSAHIISTGGTEFASWALPDDAPNVAVLVYDSTLDGDNDVRYVIGNLTSTGLTGFDIYPGVYSGPGTLDPLTYIATRKTIRYWSPIAVRYRPLRQWPLDEGNGGSPRRYGGRSTSRRTSGNAKGYQ